MGTFDPTDSANRPVILIVEDHADTRQMYAEFFATMYQVLEAADGEQALALARTHGPDVLITDLSLPVVDGFELVKRVRKDPGLAGMAIICLSGYGGHHHDEQAREAGCDRILQKPCMPDTLAEIAAELLRERARDA